MLKLLLITLLPSRLLAGHHAGYAQSPLGPREDSPTAALSVRVEKGMLSVEAHDAPLSEVLHAIAEQAAVSLEIHGDSKDRVTDSFSDERLGPGIQRLARGHNVILVYAAANGSDDRGRLVEAHVYEASAPAARLTVVPPDRSARLRLVRELMRQARQQPAASRSSLTAMVQSDEDPTVRASAANALGNIRGPETVAILTAALGDQDATVRASAMSSRGRMRDEGTVGSIAQVLARDGDVKVRRAAVWALSTLQSQDARLALEGAATDSDSDVRQAALGAIKAWNLRHASSN